jgi:uncharacterized protein YbjT (DUF2867 family)
MKSKKIIAVVGATGAQGGGLVQAILNDPRKEFDVRAITRNIGSEKARALAQQGAEVVEGDVADEKSLISAFEGAYGAYCVTFFWDHFSVEQEMAHARNMAGAAAAAHLEHVIWSTLEDTRKWVPLDDDRMPTLQGKYKVPHFDGKGESNIFFEECGVPYTLLHTSFYWDNFIYGSGPQKGQDGSLAITFPLGNKKMPGIATSDIGKCALGIFRAGKTYQGKSVGISGEHLSGQEMADTFTDVLGLGVKYNAVPPEVYRSFDFPGADDLGNMFQFKADFEKDFRSARDPSVARGLNSEMQTFKGWLEDNKHRIPIS